VAIHTKQDVIERIVYVKKEMPEVLFREEILNGESVAIIYDSITKTMFHVKGNGGAIWKLLDGRRTIRMVSEDLARASPGLDESDALADVTRFVVQLGEQRLIRFAYEV
jgi:hypothetical protein